MLNRPTPTAIDAWHYANALLAKYQEPARFLPVTIERVADTCCIRVIYGDGERPLDVFVWFEAYPDHNDGKPFLYGEF